MSIVICRPMGISVVTTGGLLGMSDPSGAKRHILQTAHTLVAHPVRRMAISVSVIGVIDLVRFHSISPDGSNLDWLRVSLYSVYSVWYQNDSLPTRERSKSRQPNIVQKPKSNVKNLLTVYVLASISRSRTGCHRRVVKAGNFMTIFYR